MDFIGGKLAQIADYLPDHYRLTICARHEGGVDADIILTDDDLALAVVAIESLQNRTPQDQAPGELCIAPPLATTVGVRDV